MTKYISNNATAKRIKYLDIENKEGFTQQRFDTIDDFYSWCKYHCILTHLKLGDGKVCFYDEKTV